MITSSQPENITGDSMTVDVDWSWSTGEQDARTAHHWGLKVLKKLDWLYRISQEG